MTPDEYLARQPPEPRAALATVRALILSRLPNGYEEIVNGGVLAYVVPLSRYPKTYNKQPLWYVALGGKKSYNSLHLMPVYMNPPTEQQLRDGFAAAGKKLDMGKACVHFKRAEDLALDVIGDLVASLPVEKWISLYEASRSARARKA